jgi:RimJ/RimL family protein N-acetyltransferase
MAEMAAVAERGIHPPDRMPFLVPWTEGVRGPGWPESFTRYHLELREHWLPEKWWLELGVWTRDGTARGAVGFHSEDFAATRTVSTASWLGTPHQRHGFGTEMRTAVLALAFEGLGARLAESSAFDWNAGSRRVSEKLGYTATGTDVSGDRTECKYELTAERWKALPRAHVEILGLEPCLPLFGV